MSIQEAYYLAEEALILRSISYRLYLKAIKSPKKRAELEAKIAKIDKAKELISQLHGIEWQ